MFIILFPGLLDSHLHGILIDSAVGNTERNGNLVIECSVPCQDLENVKVFSFIHKADVFLIEAVDKRKTNNLHRELLLTTLIVQVVCFQLWGEKNGDTFVINWMRKGECSLIESKANICQSQTW